MLSAKLFKSFGNKGDEVASSSMDPSIYNAATSGDVNFLQNLREGEASTDLIGQKTPSGNNVLHLAAEFKQINFFSAVVSSFYEGFPFVWGMNKMRETPLHVAARVGCVELVEFLIDRAQMLNVQRVGDQERGPIYSDSYKKLLRKTNLNQHTALHVAAQYGHLQVAALLIEADVELCRATNSKNESPLFLAICNGSYEIAAEILKESTISPSFKGVNGVTALHTVVGHTSPEAEDILKNMISKYPEMIEETDKIGWTALHYAAFRGNHRAVTLLMESNKPRVSHILNRHGMTALHVAAYKGHIEVMKELINYQPDTCECLNAKEQTILHIAVIGEQVDVVKYILETSKFQRLKNQADGEGYTPLQLAIRVVGESHDITRMLTPEARHGFSPGFDNFLGEHINIQVPVKNNVKKQQELSIKNTSPHGSSYGVPSFQKQIQRDFWKFHKLNPNIKYRKKSASANDAESVKIEFNLVIATLITAATFTTALNPPGGFRANGKAVLQHNVYFKWFQNLNNCAFMLSFLALIVDYIETVVWPRFFKTVFTIFFLRPGVLVMFSLFGLAAALTMGSQALEDEKPKLMPSDSIDVVSELYLILPIILCISVAIVVARRKIRK